MANLLNSLSLGQTLGTVEKGAASAIGTYGIGMLVFGQGPNVETPIGPVSANVLQAGLTALGTIFEEYTKEYIPSSIKAYGQTAEGVIARGVVPAAAYSLSSGTSTSLQSFGTNTLLGYAGSSAGLYAYQQLTGK